MTTPQLDIPALHSFLEQAFPQVNGKYRVTHVAPMALTVSMTPDHSHLRPGGTISGPTLFALCDVGVYLAILAMIGPEALAVTTGASMDFMRKPEAGRDLIADVRLLKLGRRLAVGDVHIRSEGDEALVARSTMTYSIPPSTSA